MLNTPRRDVASMAASVGFIVIGIAAFSAAADFSMLGSVFPKTISALMIFFSALYLALCWLRPQGARQQEGGSRLRQIAVAVIMLIWGFVLGPVGFLTSSVIAFALLLVVAHYGRWSPRLALLYAGAGALVLGALYLLFKVVLQVPLPQVPLALPVLPSGRCSVDS